MLLRRFVKKGRGQTTVRSVIGLEPLKMFTGKSTGKIVTG